jgi:hypothetical protein
MTMGAATEGRSSALASMAMCRSGQPEARARRITRATVGVLAYGFRNSSEGGVKDRDRAFRIRSFEHLRGR